MWLIDLGGNVVDCGGLWEVLGAGRICFTTYSNVVSSVMQKQFIVTRREGVWRGRA